MTKVKVIGGGLAGSESALYLANKGINVELYDIKPKQFSPAHTSENFAELVCSNSLKSNDIYGNAAGLLKQDIWTQRRVSIQDEHPRLPRPPSRTLVSRAQSPEPASHAGG